MKTYKYKKGVIVYIEYLLSAINSRSIEERMMKPKETMVYFKNVLWLSTAGMAKNWIKLKTTTESSILYENRSMTNFIEISGKQLFCKIAKDLTVNLNHVKRKFNFSTIELTNGEKFTVSRPFRKRLKERLSLIWED